MGGTSTIAHVRISIIRLSSRIISHRHDLRVNIDRSAVKRNVRMGELLGLKPNTSITSFAGRVVVGAVNTTLGIRHR